MPIGQVLFVPREKVVLRDVTDEEIAARRTAQEAFFREKAAVRQKTPYGLEYSPHYFRTSRLQSAGTASGVESTSDAPPSAREPAALAYAGAGVEATPEERKSWGIIEID